MKEISRRDFLYRGAMIAELGLLNMLPLPASEPVPWTPRVIGGEECVDTADITFVLEGDPSIKTVVMSNDGGFSPELTKQYPFVSGMEVPWQLRLYRPNLALQYYVYFRLLDANADVINHTVTQVQYDPECNLIKLFLPLLSAR